MTTDRPHHRALTMQEALAELRSGRGTQFAPEVVDAFLATLMRGGLELDRSNARDAALSAAG